jgi:cell division protein FtsW (lipid II flippase)
LGISACYWEIKKTKKEKDMKQETSKMSKRSILWRILVAIGAGLLIGNMALEFIPEYPFLGILFGITYALLAVMILFFGERN